VPFIPTKFPLGFFVLFAGLAFFAPAVHAGFVIESLDGDITPNELNNFLGTVRSFSVSTNNWGNSMADHASGVNVEGIRRMYEATGNIALLDQYIRFCDVFLAHRNDLPGGEHRVMWTGAVEPIWPSVVPTDPYPGYVGCESGQVAGHIAYCAWLILSNSSLWNTTVPDGNSNGYGVTYKQRAVTYLANVDYTLANYFTKWFVNATTHRIQKPKDSRWASNAGDSSCTAWNRQMMFMLPYNFGARCHEILQDNATLLAFYQDVVDQFATWFVAPYPSGGGVYYTSGGRSVVKWYYEVPTDQHIENIGHAQHDAVGLFESYQSHYTKVTSAQVKAYADTTQYVINLGATNKWAGNVDGTGTGTSLKTDFIFLSEWNPALYKLIAQSNLDANQLSGSEGCKNTGYILYMKHWFFTGGAVTPLPVAPVITTQPQGQSATVGTSITLGVSATGTAPLTYQWRKDGVAISGATGGTLTLSNVTATSAGGYNVVVGSAGGTVTSNVAQLTVVPALAVTAQPQSITVTAGSTVTLSFSATGPTALTYQWRKDGVALTGQTGSTLTLPNVTSASSGGYDATVSASGGTTATTAARVTVVATLGVSTQPQSQTVTAGATVTFSFTADGPPPLGFQWRKDGVAIAGQTDVRLVLANIGTTAAGNYDAIITSGGGAVSTAVARLNVAAPDVGVSRIANLSIRTNASTGGETLIVGFTVGGVASGTKPLLLRAAGPTLANFGVPNVLVDPQLELYRADGTKIDANDDWNGAAQLTAIGGQVGAFGFASATSKDAALFRAATDLGSYSMQVSGVGGSTGVALAEIYDATATFTASTPRLVNVSARARSGTAADVLIAGFVISGPTSKTVLIRAIGPTLAGFQVPGAMSDPQLELYDAHGTRIAQNDDWGGATALVSAFAGVGAFALEANSKDAALLTTLAPGSYTAAASGVGGTTGVVLVEVYDVP
jgi:hypothetical protein